jgi:putative endonuclease
MIGQVQPTPAPHPPHALGRAGEDAAARFLEARGLRVRERNLRTPVGEVDLICEGPDGLLVFCEVKARTRRQTEPGDAPAQALLAVSRHRRRRLARTALLYMAQEVREERPCRFDVVAVSPDDTGVMQVTHHIPCAFWCDDLVG